MRKSIKFTMGIVIMLAVLSVMVPVAARVSRNSSIDSRAEPALSPR